MRLRSMIIAVAIAATPAFTVAAQDDELTRVLIQEIRLLREELQSIAASNLRSELLLERVRMQSTIVQNLSRELEDRRNQRRYQAMEEESFNYQEQFEEEMQARLRTVTDPNERRQIEREIEMFQTRIEIQARQRLEEEARTIELQQRLDQAQANLDEYFEAIDQLIRELE
ncbi:MAG: hypothetical protein KY459_06895 [Acidobacteria bacterium]|nr:hypothetical protein [Acidobacteriota bacterium]